ncbi:response regulator [Gemmobacter lanyuensis]
MLLAEDNALVADVMRARLEKHVGPVTHAANGREALDLALQMQPDLLITDLFMPEIDGDELIRTLRERGYTRPIIGISAAVVGHDLDRFRAAGASAIMQKPLDTQQLKQCLEQLLPKDAAG